MVLYNQRQRIIIDTIRSSAELGPFSTSAAAQMDADAITAATRVADFFCTIVRFNRVELQLKSKRVHTVAYLNVHFGEAAEKKLKALNECHLLIYSLHSGEIRGDWVQRIGQMYASSSTIGAGTEQKIEKRLT